MSEYSFLFDFSRVDSFYENLNSMFFISEMDGNSNYEFVLSEHTANNIEECVDSNGCLNENVDVNDDLVVPCCLTWSNNDDGTNTISLTEDVVWSLGDDVVYMKSLFLRNASTGYVLGFCINLNTVSVSNELRLNEGTILWTVSDGGYHG